MSGIYIHIPFCKKKCFYCDFFTSQNLKYKDIFLQALKNEITLRNNFFYKESREINTIYFGGGTPSVLAIRDLESILDELHKNFNINNKAEITLEANPDDLTDAFLHNLKNLGVNRLSIGVQSFNNKYLRLMNRRHNALQAIKSVEYARNNGFDNISLDLIYGLPNSNIKDLESDLKILVSLI